MSGTWLRRYTPRYAPGPLHRCEPPMRKDGPFMDLPDGEHGFLWRCDCGKLWEVCEYPYADRPDFKRIPRWRKPNLMTRIQYRRGRR
jgi:hypothetical protein